MAAVAFLALCGEVLDHQRFELTVGNLNGQKGTAVRPAETAENEALFDLVEADVLHLVVVGITTDGSEIVLVRPRRGSSVKRGVLAKIQHSRKSSLHCVVQRESWA